MVLPYCADDSCDYGVTMKLNLTDLAIQRLKPRELQFIVWDTGLAGFGIKVSPRTKAFVVIVGDGRKQKTLGRYPDISLKDARHQAKLLQAEKVKERGPKTPTTFPEARTAFLAAKKGTLTAHSYSCYTRYLKLYPFKGYVHELTRAEIRQAGKSLDGKPHAQNMAFITMRTLMNWCLAEEMIEKHPMNRAAPPNKVSYRKRVLSDEELRKVWNACEDDDYGRIVRVLMLTGQRREEIASLKEATDEMVFPETKNGTDHRLPITPLVREHLKLPFNFKRWSAYKKKLDTRSGVAGWRLHDLRRTAASNMARLKVSPHVIEKVLNHQSGIVSGIAAVYNRYDYAEEVEEALLTYEAYILKLVRPGQVAGSKESSTRGLALS